MAAQYITLETEMKSPVLQTRPICEQRASGRDTKGGGFRVEIGEVKEKYCSQNQQCKKCY